MKRSDAVNVIYKYLEQNTDIHDFELSKVASELMTLIEGIGLKPPITKRCPVLLTNIHTWQKEEENEQI